MDSNFLFRARGFEALAELRPIEPSQQLYRFAEADDCSDDTAAPIEEAPRTVERRHRR